MVFEIGLVFLVTFVVTNGNTVGFQRKGGDRLSKKSIHPGYYSPLIDRDRWCRPPPPPMSPERVLCVPRVWIQVLIEM